MASASGPLSPPLYPPPVVRYVLDLSALCPELPASGHVLTRHCDPENLGERLTISPLAPCRPWLVQRAGSPGSPQCQSASCRRTEARADWSSHPAWMHTPHLDEAKSRLQNSSMRGWGPYRQGGGSTQHAQEEGCGCPWLECGQGHTEGEKDARELREQKIWMSSLRRTGQAALW